jgi:hypothetical protein
MNGRVAHSFTANGGGFECAAIGSVLCVFRHFCMENDENTINGCVVDVKFIASVFGF